MLTLIECTPIKNHLVDPDEVAKYLLSKEVLDNCGKDYHEWNNYERPTGQDFNFLDSDFYLENFRKTFKMPENIKCVHPFRLMRKY